MWTYSTDQHHPHQGDGTLDGGRKEGRNEGRGEVKVDAMRGKSAERARWGGRGGEGEVEMAWWGGQPHSTRLLDSTHVCVTLTLTLP